MSEPTNKTLQDLYAWSARLTDDWLGLGERLRRYADAWKADVEVLRAEVERLRDTERKFGALMHDVMDERDRLRAALGDILHYQGHLNSNVQVDMQSIARNALRASPFETKARRMTRAEADAMNRAFWRSVEIIDDIDDREEVAPGDARYYRPSENPSICPYGQSDCETTRGGVCQCAMPAEQAFDGRD